MLSVSKKEPSDELDLISGRVRLLSSKHGSAVGRASPSSAGSDDRDVTPSPPPYSIASPQKLNGTSLRLSEIEKPLLPLASTASSGLHMHNMTSIRSPESVSSDPIYPLSATWVGSSGSSGMYADHGSDSPGSYLPSATSYPTTVKLDEWMPPSTARATQANSHSSHPDIGMDGMEYGHGSTGVSSHQSYVSHSNHSLHHSLSHPQLHQQPMVRAFQPRPSSHIGREADMRYNTGYSSQTTGGHGAYYIPPGSGGTPPELYATAPRELAEMGLASQHSGITQRWTSFMQDTGLFYPQHGAPL